MADGGNDRDEFVGLDVGSNLKRDLRGERGP